MNKQNVDILLDRLLGAFLEITWLVLWYISAYGTPCNIWITSFHDIMLIVKMMKIKIYIFQSYEESDDDLALNDGITIYQYQCTSNGGRISNSTWFWTKSYYHISLKL